MDATPENPYRAPAAELLSTEDRAVGPLYRMSAVGIATFFGTPLAGAYIMAHNLRALGQQDRVRNAWWMGIGLFALVMVIGYWLPDGASMGLTVAQVIGMHQYAKSLYGEAVAGHLGGFRSNWRAFGIALLFLLAFIVVLFTVVMVTGIGEGEMTTLGGPVSVE
ncbi:hypothetical protein IB234_13240 [Pseudomonas sp. PDM16]|uniref:hypothetical protein n=1 Tax=Pseudomonas sp. PDM16 TaxID=2769292 RepID=UPI00177FD210|nr:hypothetical protein [Pseudomonas sp. PDM16]MBD9415521.1 hypothetical protein [Pseudomonas sp. PDM16]